MFTSKRLTLSSQGLCERLRVRPQICDAGVVGAQKRERSGSDPDQYPFELLVVHSVTTSLPYRDAYQIPGEMRVTLGQSPASSVRRVCSQLSLGEEDCGKLADVAQSIAKQLDAMFVGN